MSSDHRRIYLSIWDDPTFTGLTAEQQAIYFQHLSHRDLSWCGVLPYLPERLTPLSKGMTKPRAVSSISALVRVGLLVVDRTTAETLVRSYVRHDGIIKQPNVTVAMVKALNRVHSPHIVEAIEREIMRLLVDEPNARGWEGFAKVDPERLDRLRAKAKAKG